jgi:hypothetical protein
MKQKYRKHLNAFGHMLTFSMDRMPDCPVVGITNECENNRFRLFLDYDNINYEKVCKDIYYLNNDFGLCSFVVLVNSEMTKNEQWGGGKTVGNYLVFGFDVLTWKQCHDMQKTTRCDWMHKMIACRCASRNWVNRISGKYRMENGRLKYFKPVPKVKDIFHFDNKECNYKHCKAQIDFFKSRFGVELNLKNLDRCKKIDIIEYSTTPKDEDITDKIRNFIMKYSFKHEKLYIY